MGSQIDVVVTDRPHTFEVRLDGRPQSLVDLEDPTWLGFDYVRRIGDVLDACAPSGERLRVVHVGGAGLTLPRYLHATRPGSAQVVLEPDGELTARVREQLPLPRRSGIKVRTVRGREGVAALREAYADVVVLDAFEDGREPPSLLSAAFFADVRRVLDAEGLFLLNVVDRAPFAHARRVVAGLGTCFSTLAAGAEPATLRARREGNLLMVAAAGEGAHRSLGRGAARSASPYRVLDPRAVSDALGGGVPYGDPDERPHDAPSDRASGAHAADPEDHPHRHVRDPLERGPGGVADSL